MSEGENKPAGVQEQKAKDPQNVAGQPHLQDKASDETQKMWDEYQKQRDTLVTRNKKIRADIHAADKARVEKTKKGEAPNKGEADNPEGVTNAPSAAGDAAPAGAATAAAGPVGTTGTTAGTAGV